MTEPSMLNGKCQQLSADAAEFIPNSVSHPVNTSLDSGTPCYDGDLLDQIRQVMNDLEYNPASVDSVLPQILHSFTDHEIKEEMLTRVVGEILNYGITEANVRYSAAKICSYFSKHLGIQNSTANFRQILIKSCSFEHSDCEGRLSNSKCEYQMGFILFLGELLLNLEVGTSERICLLGEMVKESAMNLLQHRESKCIKCAVQLLKLTGATLVDMEQSHIDSNGLTVKIIMDKMKEQLVGNENLSEADREMLTDLIILNRSNWGRMAEEPVEINGVENHQNEADHCVPKHDVPVFYDEHGHAMDVPAEFLEFFPAEEDSYQYYIGGQELNNEVNDDFDDDEIAAAFEQFVLDSEKMQEQVNRY